VASLGGGSYGINLNLTAYNTVYTVQHPEVGGPCRGRVVAVSLSGLMRRGLISSACSPCDNSISAMTVLQDIFAVNQHPGKSQEKDLSNLGEAVRQASGGGVL
jgi:hypothetical protein